MSYQAAATKIIGNPANMVGLLKTLDECYRLGVIDAHNMSSVVDIDSFILKTEDTKKFYLLTNPNIEITWKLWRARMVFMADSRNAPTIILTTIPSAHHSRFTVLSLGYEYYRRGIMHAIQNFNPIKIKDIASTYKTKFSKAYIEWTSTGIVARTESYARGQMNLIAYELMFREQEIYEKSSFNSFLNLCEIWNEAFYEKRASSAMSRRLTEMGLNYDDMNKKEFNLRKFDEDQTQQES